MSDNFSNDEIESKLSLVIRKPQEGKTTICITSITNDTSKNIHIVLTMNTLAAGMQFFGRMKNDVGSKHIVVFNSKKQTAGDCHHAKDTARAKSLIDKENIKVIVCCAHEKRIRESLPDLLDLFADSIKFREQNIKLVIHVDEAHKYIPENRPHIRKFNNNFLVSEIIGYTATPDDIWTVKRSDPMFSKIYVRDVEEELAIIRSPHYFGVNRCHFNIYDELDHELLVSESGISPRIPDLTFVRADADSKRREWFGKQWYFDLGNELLLLSFINYIMPLLNLPHNAFSYNFMPSYTRKATHYESMELVLKHYPTANVIIMNGNGGYQLWRKRPSTGRSCFITDKDELYQFANHLSCKKERKRELDALLEPSYVIQQLIKHTPNRPTFVTGFTCVGMSVTLINQEIGNFDNVIMAHQHYSRDKLYQLCRFLFKYDSWTPENLTKIKTTEFHSLTMSVRDKCIQYEEHIEKICTEFVGKTCSLNEINGEEPEELSKSEQKNMDASLVRLTNPDGKILKKFKVYDGNDKEQWEKARQFYVNVRKAHPNSKFEGDKIPKMSMPKEDKDDPRFFKCTLSSKLERAALSAFAGFEKEKWTSRFALCEEQLSYARVFVGYDNLEDPTEYTILIKYAILEDNEDSRNFVNTYKSNKKEEDSDSVV
jgi:hypothetical protein